MHGFKTCQRFEGICRAISLSAHVDSFSKPIIQLALCAVSVHSRIGASSALLSDGIQSNWKWESLDDLAFRVNSKDDRVKEESIDEPPDPIGQPSNDCVKGELLDGLPDPVQPPSLSGGNYPRFSTMFASVEGRMSLLRSHRRTSGVFGLWTSRPSTRSSARPSLRATGNVRRPCRANSPESRTRSDRSREGNAGGPPKIQGYPRFGEDMDNHGSTFVVGMVVLCLLSGHFDYNGLGVVFKTICENLTATETRNAVRQLDRERIDEVQAPQDLDHD